MPSLIAQHVSPLEDDAFRATNHATARIVCGGSLCLNGSLGVLRVRGWADCAVPLSRSLNNIGLTGTIPTEIAALTALTWL